MNRTELTKAAGVSRAALYAWIKGSSTPSIATLALVARLTGTSLGWLVSGEGAMRPGEEVPGGYALPASPFYNVQPPPFAFKEEWLADLITESGAKKPGEQIYLIAVTDDAMEPTLKRKDLLLVHRRALRRGESGLYALVIRDPVGTGQLVARRIQWELDGTLTIRCDNPAYRSETRALRAEEAPQIVGPILWRAGYV
ncbi:MAG TPA: helix-turn-helix domain-containing protein [Candidatus Binataceae bacterium]|nr:helix-turn-helix domain-containing protein [Candidatus Binataceae bacterium]